MKIFPEKKIGVMLYYKNPLVIPFIYAVTTTREMLHQYGCRTVELLALELQMERLLYFYILSIWW